MDVFSAFPNAIISEQWELCEKVEDTEIGTTIQKRTPLDAIVDEGTSTTRSDIPEMESDMLIYAQPAQLPTVVSARLTNGYLCHDKTNDFYYEIRDASLGKNQETGAIEHIELLLRQTEVVDGEF